MPVAGRGTRPCCSTRSARWSSSSRRGRCCAGALRRGTASRCREQDAKRAMLAEMTYYRAHHHEGHDAALAGRPARGAARRCSASSCRRPPRCRDADLVEVLLDVAALPSLPGRRAGARPAAARSGIRAAVVSNWDCSLRRVLAELGLGGLVDEIVVSAEVGAAKPDPAIFEAALRRLRCPAAQGAVRGRLARDRHGRRARAAGVRAVLVDRARHAPPIRRGSSASSPSRISTSCSPAPAFPQLLVTDDFDRRNPFPRPGAPPRAGRAQRGRAGRALTASKGLIGLWRRDRGR